MKGTEFLFYKSVNATRQAAYAAEGRGRRRAREGEGEGEGSAGEGEGERGGSAGPT
jgi:hypothetical protein